MSAGRRHRRRISKSSVTYRPVGVELAHETREWVARLNAAHDDDNVSFDDFKALVVEWSRYADALPAAERVEASMRIGDHVNSQLAGMRVEVVACVTPRHGRPTIVARRIA